MGRTCGISDEDAEAIGNALADEATPGLIDAINETEQFIVDVSEIANGFIDPSWQD